MRGIIDILSKMLGILLQFVKLKVYEFEISYWFCICYYKNSILD